MDVYELSKKVTDKFGVKPVKYAVGDGYIVYIINPKEQFDCAYFKVTKDGSVSATNPILSKLFSLKILDL